MSESTLQSPQTLARRRRVAAALNIGVLAVLLAALAAVLGAPHWTPLRVAIFALYALAAPWNVLGLTNSLIGLWLAHGRGDPLQKVAPFAVAPGSAPLASRTAILMTLRNEDPRRAILRLRAIAADLERIGESDGFDFFVLSDSDRPAIFAREEEEIARWRRDSARPERIFYRRRQENNGFKAGNILDFCDRWGETYTFMIPLDADSLMTAEALTQLARIGENNPQIGIVQTLAVGAPSGSAFARIFQFGMRHGMRAYTLGAAWWAGDCGPFWGHNALVRVAPFAAHCRLPELPGGEKILSHDQVEAAFMRRAGFETRILPVEGGSFEDNPPSLPDFVQRETRWCRGNLQYVHLLGLPGLKPMSRFQLCWAIAMFAGAPAATLLLALAAALPHVEPDAVSAGPVLAFYLVHLAVALSPKLIGMADVLLTPGGLARYGGAERFAAGALVELPLSFCIGAATSFAVCLQMLALPFGRQSVWGGQNRDAHALGWRDAARAFWPQTLYGLMLLSVAGSASPALVLWSAPLWIGYAASIPFAVLSASKSLGAAMTRRGLCATPEEIAPPPVFAGLYPARTRDALSEKPVSASV